MFKKKLDRLLDKVVEVERVLRAEPLLVGEKECEELGVDLRLVRIPAEKGWAPVRQLAEYTTLVLESSELPAEWRGSQFFAERRGMVLDELFYDLKRIVVIVDAVAGSPAERGGVVSENPRSEGVEGADKRTMVCNSLAHLIRRFVREGNGDYLLPGHALPKERHEAAGQGLGLPRTGAGGDKERSLPMPDGLLLGGVQS